MTSTDAEAQIKQMITFIINEAQQKKDDIEAKGESELSLEVTRIRMEQQEKIRQEYEKKAKKIDTDCKIKKSLAINKQRLEKIKQRQEVMMKIKADSKVKLAEQIKDASYSKGVVVNLIVQGLLKLLEEQVVIRCKDSDKTMVQGCLADATAKYSEVIKKETGAVKKCMAKLDTTYLPSSCLGGVVLLTPDMKISIDNTIDTRLTLVMEQDKPAIRSLLFPVKS
jgi:V-type H+-transporting ATPase subunit E